MKLIYGIIILLLSLTVLSTACSTNNTSTQNYDMLAQCMTANGATMYGTEWCPHCKSQKELFGKSFAYIDYVDCDKYNDECVNAGVEGYPTWKINGTLYAGTQNMYLLAEKSGCLDKLATE